MIEGVQNTTPFLRLLDKNTKQQNETLTRLSTGQRINKGSDDPAGLIAATRLQSDIAAVEAESRALTRINANANITDGHLSQLSGMAADVRGHLIAAANTGGLSDAELDAHQLEVDHLTRQMQLTTYDAVESLDGINLPDDGNSKLAEQLTTAAHQVSTLATGGENDLRSGRFAEADAVVAEATTAFAEGRGTVGGYQRTVLAPRIEAAAVERESLLAAHSQIMDADFAEEVSNLARDQVRTAAAGETLRIANHNAASVLRLLE